MFRQPPRRGADRTLGQSQTSPPKVESLTDRSLHCDCSPPQAVGRYFGTRPLGNLRYREVLLQLTTGIGKYKSCNSQLDWEERETSTTSYRKRETRMCWRLSGTRRVLEKIRRNDITVVASVTSLDSFASRRGSRRGRVPIRNEFYFAMQNKRKRE